jgi:hypothetical protein
MPFNSGSQFWFNVSIGAPSVFSVPSVLCGVTPCPGPADAMNASGYFYGVTAAAQSGTLNISYNITGYLSDYYDTDGEVKQAAVDVLTQAGFSISQVFYFGVQDSLSGQLAEPVKSGPLAAVAAALGLGGSSSTTLWIVGGLAVVAFLVLKK